MNHLTPPSFTRFKDAIVEALPIFLSEKLEKSYWSGKKVFLGYSDQKGWKVYELGFFAQIFRKLNLAYRDTHRQFILTKLENLTTEEARFISQSQIAKNLPKLNLKSIYDEKVRNKIKEDALLICNSQSNEDPLQSGTQPLAITEHANRSTEQPIQEETSHLIGIKDGASKEEISKHSRDEVPAIDAAQESVARDNREKRATQKAPSIFTPQSPSLVNSKKRIPRSKRDLQNSLTIHMDLVETDTPKSAIKKTESPPATTPLYLKNFKCTRCYMDSVLEIMLSQDSIREKIFKESARTDLSPEKTELLEALRDLIIIAHETKGKGKGNQSPIGENSPGERIRKAIFASKLNADLSDFKEIYTQQDASSVLLLINDLLDHSFQTVEIDTGRFKDKKIVAKRPVATNHKLELRFKNEWKVNTQMNHLIEQILPLLFLEDDTSIEDCNHLIDQLISQIQKKKNQLSDANQLILNLQALVADSEFDLNEIFDQLISLKSHLKTKTHLHTLIDQFFKPELATDCFNKKVTRKFTLPDASTIDSTYVTQTKLISVPELLTLHVSRYAFDPQKGPIKIGDPVALPADGIVDMTPYYSGERGESYQYEMMGYVVHHGESLNSGHYTANVKIGDKFYECDDLNPKPPFHREISAKEFYGNENAYLVMLKRIPNKSTQAPAA